MNEVMEAVYSGSVFLSLHKMILATTTINYNFVIHSSYLPSTISSISSSNESNGISTILPISFPSL